MVDGIVVKRFHKVLTASCLIGLLAILISRNIKTFITLHILLTVLVKYDIIINMFESKFVFCFF